MSRTSYPFSDGLSCTGSGVGATEHHFTGKERDVETGLDYFGARYNASSVGRFMTPDPIGIIKQKLRDPQQWNMYSYTRGNPIRFLDPTGMYNTDCAESDITKCSAEIQNFEANRKKDLQSTDPAVRAAAAAFGSFNDKNKVDLKFDPNAAVGKTQQEVSNGKATDRVAVTMPSLANGVNIGTTGLIAHEGSHIEDIQSSIAGQPVTHFQSEMKAYMTQAGVLQDFIPRGVPSFMSIVDNGVSLTLMSPFDDDARGVNSESVRDFLVADPRYGLKESNQGGPVGVQPQ